MSKTTQDIAGLAYVCYDSYTSIKKAKPNWNLEKAKEKGYEILSRSSSKKFGGGFYALAFKHKNHADEIVIAIRGTVGYSLSDWNENIRITNGKGFKEQLDELKTYVAKIQSHYPDHQIIFTGHSKGGALSHLAAAQFNAEAVTFDAPGTKAALEQAYPNYDNSKITDIVVKGSIIGNSTQHIGSVYELDIPNQLLIKKIEEPDILEKTVEFIYLPERLIPPSRTGYSAKSHKKIIEEDQDKVIDYYFNKKGALYLVNHKHSIKNIAEQLANNEASGVPLKKITSAGGNIYDAISDLTSYSENQDYFDKIVEVASKHPVFAKYSTPEQAKEEILTKVFVEGGLFNSLESSAQWLQGTKMQLRAMKIDEYGPDFAGHISSMQKVLTPIMQKINSNHELSIEEYVIGQDLAKRFFNKLHLNSKDDDSKYNHEFVTNQGEVGKFVNASVQRACQLQGKTEQVCNYSKIVLANNYLTELVQNPKKSFTLADHDAMRSKAFIDSGLTPETDVRTLVCTLSGGASAACSTVNDYVKELKPYIVIEQSSIEVPYLLKGVVTSTVEGVRSYLGLENYTFTWKDSEFDHDYKEINSVIWGAIDNSSKMWKAVNEGYIPEVARLLSLGELPNLSNKEAGRSLLEQAVKNQDNDMVDLLLTHGAAIKCSRYGYLKFMNLHKIALERGNVEIIQSLIKKGLPVEEFSIKNIIEKNNPTLLAFVLEAFNSDYFNIYEFEEILYLAIRNQQLSIVKEILAAGVQKNLDIKELITEALWYSLSVNNPKIGEILIQYGANTNCPSKYNTRLYILEEAVKNKKEEFVEILVKNGADTNIICEYSHEPVLELAIKNNNYNICKLLIDNGARVKDSFLHKVVGGNYKIYEILLKNGGDPNSRNEYGNSILNYPLQEENFELCKLLFAYNADPNLPLQLNNSDSLPIVRAINYNSSQIIELILTNGAKVNISTKDGYTPLIYSTDKGEEIFSLLTKYGAIVDKTVHGDKNLLVLAVKNRKPEIARILLEKYNFDPDQQDQYGNPVLENTMHKEIDYIEIANILLEQGANPNICNKHKLTPLHFAVVYDCYEQVKLLLEYKADANHINPNNKNSILAFALERASIEVVEELLKHNADPNYCGTWYNNSIIYYAARSANLDKLSLVFKYGAAIEKLDCSTSFGVCMEYAVMYKGMFELLYNNIHDYKMKHYFLQDGIRCAIKERNAEALAFVLNNGADPNGKIPMIIAGPMYLALHSKSANMVKILLEHGADPNQSGCGGCPLKIAINTEQPEMIKLLLDFGANPKLIDSEYKSFQEMVAESKNQGLIDIFSEYLLTNGSADTSQISIEEILICSDETDIEETFFESLNGYTYG